MLATKKAQMVRLLGREVGLNELFFASELFFTTLKALALQSNNICVRASIAIPCFLIESGLGIAQATLLLLVAFQEVKGPVLYADVKILTSVACVTEVFNVLSEGANIWRKVRIPDEKLTEHQGFRFILKWIAFAFGIGTVVVIRLLFTMNTVVFITLLVALGLGALISIMLGEKLHSRMIIGFALVVASVIAATILSFAMERETNNGINAQDFTKVRTTPLFFLVGACLLTSFAFCCLPDIADHEVQKGHVRALEVAAFAVPPSAVLSVIEPVETKVQRRLLFALISQVVALVMPILFAFLTIKFRCPNRQNDINGANP